MRKVKKADGGRAKRKSVLDSIRPNFKDAPKEKEHFDGGGYVGYFTPDTGYNPSESFNPNLQDVTNPDLNEVTAGNDTYLNAQNDPNAYANTGSSGGGGLAGLAKAAAPYAALVPLLGAVASKLGGSGSSSGSTSLPAGQSTSAGPFQAQASPRTMNAVDPNTDWYTYGEHPETQFYNDNSIGPLMGQFAAQPTAGSSSPSGASPTTSPAIPMPAPTATAQPVGMNNPRPTLKAAGGALDTLSPDNGTAATGQSRHVSGAGDGTSDDIDAKLSDGEYVIDANTVSMLGNGSNKAGAARLDQLRENLRKHAAKPMAKGKQFMKAKAPEAYMRGGSK